MEASQEDVFRIVGSPAVQNAIEGFNSTIFAYGQTGSGKTFTLTGGPEKYSDRGIIPRALSMLFSEFRSRSDTQFKMYISYLEIYNETGYDLLDPSHETKSLEELPKVTMLEDEFGNFHLKNLSMHPADSEEDALNLLFMGDTNRAIAETPMNMASSRSHCMFSIAIEARPLSGETVRRSKLHLVDLAGSERVSKTNASGSLLREAKAINSSLFFLEMVIVALYEKATKGRAHVPYRNSMMTSVLRDSLGGNCKTVMIATVNPETAQTEESLSTCRSLPPLPPLPSRYQHLNPIRFAQRVSLIKNKATVNEDLDPSVVIQRLKGDVLNLREEISFLKGESGDGDALTPKEIEDLRDRCREYCANSSEESALNIGKLTLTKIRQAFSILRSFVLEARSIGCHAKGEGEFVSTPEMEELLKQIRDLKSSLLQRDNEIAILVNMVKKGRSSTEPISISTESSIPAISAETKDSREEMYRSAKMRAPSPSPQTPTVNTLTREELLIKRHLFGVQPPSDPAVFEDAASSFEWFRQRCSLGQSMEENKEVLKEKINEAKTLGERANQSRNTINYLKNSIEAIRKERAMHRIQGDGKEDEKEIEEETSEETTFRRAIEQEKAVYKEAFERLRVLKPEIEHIKKVLEKGRTNLQSQFDQWFQSLHNRDLGPPPHSSDDKHTPPSPVPSQPITTKVRKLISSSPEPISPPMSSAPSKDDDVNEDILAFYQAKEELLKRRAAR